MDGFCNSTTVEPKPYQPCFVKPAHPVRARACPKQISSRLCFTKFQRNCSFNSCQCVLQVVAFIKGTRTQPQCGFSHKMLTILNNLRTEYEVRGEKHLNGLIAQLRSKEGKASSLIVGLCWLMQVSNCGFDAFKLQCGCTLQLDVLKLNLVWPLSKPVLTDR
jgi:hypothetical protein